MDCAGLREPGRWLRDARPGGAGDHYTNCATLRSSFAGVGSGGFLGSFGSRKTANDGSRTNAPTIFQMNMNEESQTVQKLEPNPGPGCHVPLRVPTNSPKDSRINNLSEH